MSFVVTEIVRDGGKLLIEAGIPIPDIKLEGIPDFSEVLVTILTFWNPVKRHLPRRVQKLMTVWLLVRWFGKGIAYSTLGLNAAEAQGSAKKAIIDTLFDFVSEFYPPKIVVDILAQNVRSSTPPPKSFVLGVGSRLRGNYGMNMK